MKKSNSGRQTGILAINGGKPVMGKPLPGIHNVDAKELAAVKRVILNGPLSGFLGTWSKGFYGGTEVRAFEEVFAKKFKVKHAVSCNSATSGLHMAIVALGIGPGDEVIVPPYSMSASATCVLMNGAVPVFADIDPDTFCIDPKSVEERITKNTKAIMVVNLFGQAADYANLLKVAKKHNLKIIEDNAQSPGATWRGNYTGTIGDIGVFSLNIHKTMQTGEGGVLVTNNDTYALRAQLSRNHGESVTPDMEKYDAGPIFGGNYRMAEIIAAMARVQLGRLDILTKKRVALAKRLRAALDKVPGLTTAAVGKDNEHVYYRFTIKVDKERLGISRDQLANAMAAEGFPMSKGYVKPIYLLDIFQQRKAFNNTEFPFKNNYYDGTVSYAKGICPVVERMHETELTLTDVCQHPYTKDHVDLFIKAIHKVLAHKDELK